MLPLTPPARVLVRPVPLRYPECLREDRAVSIDLERARQQHAGYVRALREAGAQVGEVDASDETPDACFLEDAAVVTGRHALSTRPGAPSRRAEVEGVARALAAFCTVCAMEAPATLDGGDVLRAGSTLFVGLSSRTNQAGAQRLAEVARLDGLETRVLRVTGGLHLKSACTLADATTLLYAPALLGEADLAPFRDLGLTCLAAPEPAGANVLALGSRVLVSAAAPRTSALLAQRGLDVRLVDVGEFHKGDGALTCLSLRIPPQGGWST
jgi:dimethylargininase